MLVQNQKWIILIILYLIRDIVSVSINGTIEDEISFYYQELPAQPSMIATLVYRITYPLADRDDYVDVQFYTTSKHSNIDKKCTCRPNGQALNVYMHFSNSLNTGCSKCCEEIYSGHLQCSSGINIQDYIPRRFGFSLGFNCNDASDKSLKGTTYSVEVYSQTNRTTCSAMPKTSVNCSKFHASVSYPNLFGHNRRVSRKSFKYLVDTANSSNINLDCYPYLKEFVCNLFFPKCLRESHNVTVPCREMFEELKMGCTASLLAVTFLGDPEIGSYHNNYLPSRDGSIPCWYKPVVCGPPPNATDTVIAIGLNDSGIYYGGTTIVYSCNDESLVISGNSTVTCLYNGFWSHSPVCVKVDQKYLLRILLPVLSLGTCVIVSATIAIICIKRKKKTVLSLTRRRTFDAYVCYDFDRDHDFVIDTIFPAFEENQNPPFKLCIHSRDFTPGIEIFENIQKAISLSNSAIIIMSQEFVNSLWCKKEFEQCFIENINDPAFKLFLIMMQPADSLENLTEYMASFISQKTYLERDDPNLVGKISEYLNWVKQPKGDREDNEEDGDDEEQIEDGAVLGAHNDMTELIDFS